MRLSVVNDLYPNAAKLVRRLVKENAIDPMAVENLSAYSLARINDGSTPEADAVRLLKARTAALARRR